MQDLGRGVGWRAGDLRRTVRDFESYSDVDDLHVTAALEHDSKAGDYGASTWLGKFLFDLVAVWRAAMRPWIVTMLVLYYGWVKYQIVNQALPLITDWKAAELNSLGIWTVSDYELLLLGVTFYLGKRTFEKLAGRS